MSDTALLIQLTAGRCRVVLPARCVRQVLAARELIQVPLARSQVAGVLAHDGRALPVYRLEDLPLGDRVRDTRRHPPGHGDARGARHEIVIVEEEGALAGFLVERVDAVRKGPRDSVRIVEPRALLGSAGVFDSATGHRPATQAVQGEP